MKFSYSAVTLEKSLTPLTPLTPRPEISQLRCEGCVRGVSDPLHLLDSLGLNGDGYLDVCLMRPGLPICQRFLPLNDRTRLERMIASAVMTNLKTPGSSVFFGVNARVRRRGRDVDVARVSSIVLDLDGRGLSIEEQRRRVRLIGLHPTVVALSGTRSDALPVGLPREGAQLPLPSSLPWKSHGKGLPNGTLATAHRHVYWRIDPPCDPEKARLVGKRLRIWLKADPSEMPSKRMRLPGSYNWKSGAPVLIRYRTWPTAVTLEQFERALDAAGVPTLGVPLPVAPRVAPPPTGRLLDMLPDRIRELVVNGGLGRYESRSARDFAVVNALVTVGADDDQIEEVFEGPVGDKAHEPSNEGYLQRTIDKARRVAFVRVQVVDMRTPVASLGSRVVLRLRPPRGKVFSSGVTAGSPQWGYLWKAAGLPAPKLPCRLAPLRGRSLLVWLVAGQRMPLVHRWIATEAG